MLKRSLLILLTLAACKPHQETGPIYKTVETCDKMQIIHLAQGNSTGESLRCVNQQNPAFKEGQNDNLEMVNATDKKGK